MENSPESQPTVENFGGGVKTRPQDAPGWIFQGSGSQNYLLTRRVTGARRGEVGMGLLRSSKDQFLRAAGWMCGIEGCRIKTPGAVE